MEKKRHLSPSAPRLLESAHRSVDTSEGLDSSTRHRLFPRRGRPFTLPPALPSTRPAFYSPTGSSLDAAGLLPTLVLSSADLEIRILMTPRPGHRSKSPRVRATGPSRAKLECYFCKERADAADPVFLPCVCNLPIHLGCFDEMRIRQADPKQCRICRTVYTLEPRADKGLMQLAWENTPDRKSVVVTVSLILLYGACFRAEKWLALYVSGMDTQLVDQYEFLTFAGILHVQEIMHLGLTFIYWQTVTSSHRTPEMAILLYIFLFAVRPLLVPASFFAFVVGRFYYFLHPLWTYVRRVQHERFWVIGREL